MTTPRPRRPSWLRLELGVPPLASQPPKRRLGSAETDGGTTASHESRVTSVVGAPTASPSRPDLSGHPFPECRPSRRRTPPRAAARRSIGSEFTANSWGQHRRYESQRGMYVFGRQPGTSGWLGSPMGLSHTQQPTAFVKPYHLDALSRVGAFRASVARNCVGRVAQLFVAAVSGCTARFIAIACWASNSKGGMQPQPDTPR